MNNDKSIPVASPPVRLRLKFGQWIVPAVVLCLGVAVSVGLFEAARAWQLHRSDSVFSRAAGDRIAAIKKDAEADVFVVQALAGFYDGSESVERDEFLRFVKPCLAWQPDIRALIWVPRVKDDERAAYEDRARREGLPGFHFVDPPADRSRTPAAKRPEYYPVYYVEPIESNRQAVGLDISMEPNRQEAMGRARDTGQAAVTAAINLFLYDRSETGVLIFVPVYQRGVPTETVEQRRAALRGFVAGVFEIQNFLEEFLGQLSVTGVDVHLYDLSAPPDRQLIGSRWSSTRTGDEPTTAPGPAGPADGLHEEATFAVAGREWKVLCVAAPAFTRMTSAWESWAVLAGGLALTVLLAAYLLITKLHTVRTEWLASELMAANRSLHEQMAQREETEKARHDAEEAARGENAKLLAMISGMDEGIIFANAETTIVEVNDYFCRFVRLSRDEIMGKKIADFHGGRIWVSIQEHIDRFRREPGCSPLVFQRPVGQAEVIFRMQPIYTDGRYDGVLLNVIDVTELVKARRLAEESSRAKGEFLANMSHEIRTPMTAIMGFAELIDNSIECCNLCASHQNCQTRAQNKEYIKIIRRNGDHLLELINDILDLSKIEAGKLTIETRPCDLPAIIADVTSMMRVRAEQRGIGLAVEFAGEIPETIRTDGARLRQALVNLMGNAVKFTERGGVRIVAAFIPSWKEAPAVRIDVIDTGIGINAEKLSQLFQPFSQADPSTSRKYGGTGLGLTIARHIAELLGGTLTVQSAPGQGSTFTLTVPTGDIEGVLMVHGHGEAVRGAAAGAVLRTQDLPSLAGLRILLAEDGIDNQRLIKTLLTLSGAEVRIAEDGREAVTLAQTGAFDVVLMDMQMPEMDGYEATRILRQAGYDRPILALTAHVMEGDRERCLEVGCNDHLTKPVDRRRLIGAVALYAGRLAMESGGRAEPASEPSPSPLPLRSAYAEDPDLAPILVDFVEGLAGQVERMRLALGGGAYEELKRQAHQLKGAGGSYGYPSLTDTAKRLEEAAKAHDTEAAGMALGRLAALCDAIVRGAAAEPAPREARS